MIHTMETEIECVTNIVLSSVVFWELVKYWWKILRCEKIRKKMMTVIEFILKTLFLYPYASIISLEEVLSVVWNE